MKHTELSKGDVVITRSIYDTMSVVVVDKVTAKTVVTKYTESSNFADRHGRFFGNVLWLFDEEKLTGIRNIDEQIKDLRNKRQVIINSLEKITIGDE